MDLIVSRTYQRSKDKVGMMHISFVSDRTTVEFSGTSNQLISFSLVSIFMFCLCFYSGYLDDFFAKTCDFWQNQSFYFQYKLPIIHTCLLSPWSYYFTLLILYLCTWVDYMHRCKTEKTFQNTLIHFSDNDEKDCFCFLRTLYAFINYSSVCILYIQTICVSQNSALRYSLFHLPYCIS